MKEKLNRQAYKVKQALTNGVARIGLKTWPCRSQADEERSVQ